MGCSKRTKDDERKLVCLNCCDDETVNQAAEHSSSLGAAAMESAAQPSSVVAPQPPSVVASQLASVVAQQLEKHVCRCGKSFQQAYNLKRHIARVCKNGGPV